MNLKKLVISFSMAVFCLPVSAETWLFSSPYEENSYMTQNDRLFSKRVDELTSGKIKIDVHAGATLLALPETKPGVQSGQIQIGEAIQGAFGNEDPVFGVDMLPFLVGSPDEAQKLWRASKSTIEELLEKQGLKLLYVSIWPGQSLLTNMPISSLKDLEKKRLRTQSPTTSELITLLKGIGTQVEVADIPQAFLTSMVVGMFTSDETTANLSGWDYIKYSYQVNAWYPKNLIFMSSAKWKSLDEPTRQAISQAAQEAELRSWSLQRDVSAEKTRLLAERGVQIIEPSELLMGQLQAVGGVMLDSWLQKTAPLGRQIIERYRAGK